MVMRYVFSAYGFRFESHLVDFYFVFFSFNFRFVFFLYFFSGFVLFFLYFFQANENPNIL